MARCWDRLVISFAEDISERAYKVYTEIAVSPAIKDIPKGASALKLGGTTTCITVVPIQGRQYFFERI